MDVSTKKYHVILKSGFTAGFVVLLSFQSFAGKVGDILANDLASSAGFLVMGGIVLAGIVFYIVYNHFVKDKEDETPPHPTHHHHHSHSRHHRNHHHSTQRAVKKTPSS